MGHRLRIALVPLRMQRMCRLKPREMRRFGESKHQDLFARRRADVLVQAHHLRAADFLEHRFEHGPGRFNEVRSHLLHQQIPPLLGRQRLHQVLLSRSQNSLQPEEDQIADEVRMNILQPAAHIFPLEAADAVLPLGPPGAAIYTPLKQFSKKKKWR